VFYFVYVCVCVCVCARARTRTHTHTQGVTKRLGHWIIRKISEKWRFPKKCFI